LASDIVELIVLSADEQFLATLREALGTATRLWHVSAPDKVADLLTAGEVGILILDGASMNEQSASFITQIKKQFPDLVILFAGTRDDESGLTALVSNGAVYRFIHKPMSVARAKLFVQAAVKKHGDPRTTTTVIAPPKLREANRGNRSLVIGIAAAAAAIIAALLWWNAQSARISAKNAALAAAAGAADPTLAKAAEALAANRLTEPSGDNALELYLMKLARAPNDATARAGLAEVHERLLSRAENALMEERVDVAQSAIDTARKAGVESGRIAFLSAQLNKLREQSKTAQARVHAQNELAANRDKLSEAVQSAAQRIDQNRLIEPQSDSALFFVNQALRLDPQNLSAQQTKRALSARILLETRTAIDGGDFDKASRWLQAADGVASQADIDSTRTALIAARNQAQTQNRDQLLRLANERLQQDRLIEPANDSAKYYLLSLRALDPAFAGLNTATQDFTGKSLAKARRALNLGQFEAAKTWLDGAAAMGASSGDAAAVKSELDAAIHAQTDAQSVVGATTLRRLNTVEPEYPLEAARSRIEGWVDLEFTVNRDGSVRDTLIRNSQPVGVFDHAAAAALAKWRFAPVLRDNKPVEQRARIRVRFSLRG
jgi:protein TonB